MAELILRLGSALVGFLLIFAHGLLLAVIPQADCSPDLWPGSWVFSGFAAVAALALLPAALRWRATLRWCALPVAALELYGLRVALPLLAVSRGAAASLCDALGATGAHTALPASGWERGWAPVQIALIALCVWQCLRYWQTPPEVAEVTGGY